MKIKTQICLYVLTLCSFLGACTASKEPTLYVLNPEPFIKSAPKHQPGLRIGINSITIPEYLDHPQLIIFLTDNQSQLLEHDQWAESLENNVQRIIQTNITNKLPSDEVEIAPWDSSFYPQYHLRIEISQLKVDIQGNSVLRAIYYIESDNKILHQYQIQLTEKLPVVNPTTVVLSTNHLINQLSDEVAKTVSKLSK